MIVPVDKFAPPAEGPVRRVLRSIAAFFIRSYPTDIVAGI